MAELLANKDSVGVIVARMQVPYLTDSHKRVIKTVMDRHQITYLFLGVDDRTDIVKNPFSFSFRKRMIEVSLGRDTTNTVKWNLEIIPIHDIKDNNMLWRKSLDTLIRDLIYPKTAILYGGRDSFISIYETFGGDYDTQELSKEDYDSGTELREISSNLELVYSKNVANAILATIKLCGNEQKTI